MFCASGMFEKNYINRHNIDICQDVIIVIVSVKFHMTKKAAGSWVFFFLQILLNFSIVPARW